MKGFWRMKRMKIYHGILRMGSIALAVIWMLACGGSAFAATSTGAEFKMDLRGLRPWKTHPASTSETIAYSTAWATNLTAAESRIRDADMAKTMMEFVKLQILNQSGTSMLAQANQLPQQVLSLLQ